MGFIGNKDFSFVMLVSDQVDELFNGWAYAQEFPEVGQGIIASQDNCNFKAGQDYDILEEEFRRDKRSPGEFDCLLYDSHIATLNALNLTIKFMDSKKIHRRCLENQFYFDPENKGTI
eukprot:Awhi_evm2s9834